MVKASRERSLNIIGIEIDIWIDTDCDWDNDFYFLFMVMGYRILKPDHIRLGTAETK